MSHLVMGFTDRDGSRNESLLDSTPTVYVCVPTRVRIAWHLLRVSSTVPPLTNVTNEFGPSAVDWYVWSLSRVSVLHRESGGMFGPEVFLGTLGIGDSYG